MVRNKHLSAGKGAARIGSTLSVCHFILYTSVFRLAGPLRAFNAGPSTARCEQIGKRYSFAGLPHVFAARHVSSIHARVAIDCPLRAAADCPFCATTDR